MKRNTLPPSQKWHPAHRDVAHSSLAGSHRHTLSVTDLLGLLWKLLTAGRMAPLPPESLRHKGNVCDFSRSDPVQCQETPRTPQELDREDETPLQFAHESGLWAFPGSALTPASASARVPMADNHVGNPPWGTPWITRLSIYPSVSQHLFCHNFSYAFT